MTAHSHYNPEGTKTLFSVFLMVNSTLGSGLLNFPKTFDDAGGIVAASIVQIILLVFVMISLLALAYASDQCGTHGAENIQVVLQIKLCRLILKELDRI
jgi:sodium-coupled neutral amino acid transporter 7/8